MLENRYDSRQVPSGSVRRPGVIGSLAVGMAALLAAGCGGPTATIAPPEFAAVPVALASVPAAVVETVESSAEAVGFAPAEPSRDEAKVDGWAPLTTNGDVAHRKGKTGGILKVGKPYQVAGRWYYPSHQPDYDQIGMASWYGDNFHGKSTANGEKFRMGALMAAHPTLPLPSLVKVTNLDNGRALLVRVNDRGPYKPGRIIDLSKEAARLLGFAGAGVAKVRVQYHGTASLDGGDAQERKFLAAQSWYQPKVASLDAESAVVATTASWEPAAKKSTAQAEPTASSEAWDAEAVPEAKSQVAAGQFIVQAGSFRSEGNARRVAKLLKSVGAVRVIPETRGAALIYVVTVGPFKDSGNANDTLRALVDLGIADAVVRRL